MKMRQWLVVLACFVASVVGSWVFFSGQKGLNSSQQLTSEGSASASLAPPEATAKPDPQVPLNILLLGYGGTGHDGNYLSDTMILVKVLPKEQRVLMFNIPRDLWVKIDFMSSENQPYYSKINAVYLIGVSDKNYPNKPEQFTGKMGGGEAAKSVVSEIIGEPIDYFVGVDFDGFVRILKTLAGGDGLKVDVPYSFTDEFYPLENEKENTCGFSEEEIATLMETYTGYNLEKQFTCRYETVSFQKGQQQIAPLQALKFVRSRHSSVGGSDFGRAQRQQALLTAVKNEVLTPTFLLKIPSLFSELNKSVTTDLGIGDVTKIITNYGDPRAYTMESYVIDTTNLLTDGRSRDGQAILMPRAGQDDYTEIVDFIEEKVGSASASAAQ